ncbi:MAG: class I SAM-dependent methyltransferase [Planctomycetes bacterium]|nr:class I SAM-dependent methyltransferase [Planctomycetota bacterium]
MTTDYDPIAEQYQRSKQQPWRHCIECHTLMELIGDLSGMSAMDVACGEGFYTRLIRQRGAARVVGVDLSQGMIELARQQEARHQLGVDYLVGDARELSGAEPCDLVSAAYLLNYAGNRQELQAMCDGIANCLKPGGRFITVNCNPARHFPTAPSYRKYGFETTVTEEWREGTPIRWTFHLEDGPFDIENYHLDTAIHEAALSNAGFHTIRWHAPRLSPEGSSPTEVGFWSTFMDHSPVAFLECVK